MIKATILATILAIYSVPAPVDIQPSPGCDSQDIKMMLQVGVDDKVIGEICYKENKP